MTFTHGQLVNVARKWLARRCAVVATELATRGIEHADALGFDGKGVCTLVECKTSVGDFRADASKVFRAHSYLGMGAERYYLTPAGMVSGAELPENWGLLAWDGRKVRVMRRSGLFEERAHDREKLVLVSLLRRLYAPGSSGVMVRCYTISSGFRARATLGITPGEE